VFYYVKFFWVSPTRHPPNPQTRQDDKVNTEAFWKRMLKFLETVPHVVVKRGSRGHMWGQLEMWKIGMRYAERRKAEVDY
jgi:hypothetical protein